MVDFVLVHGAWHGAWCWRRLEPLLAAKGHRAWTPTLTGQGASVHLATSSVGLATHVVDIENTIRSEELNDIVLVGHSYAGIVASVVACRMPERIRRLVYLDAFVPSPDRSLFDLVSPEERDQLRLMAASGAQPWLLPPFPPAGYGVMDSGAAAWLSRQLTPMTIACFEDVVRFDEARLLALPRTYVHASRSERDRFERFAAPFRKQGAPSYFEIPSGHDMMITHAAETAHILDAVAG